MTDDPIKRLLQAMAETLSSEYNATIFQLMSSLQNAGVTQEEIETVMNEVPDIAAPHMNPDSENDMVLLDLLFLGLLVHRFRDHIIEVEGSESG